jgi:hypothetical protein
MSFDVTKRLSQLKSSAKTRGINVNLDVNKYQLIIDSGCHFCGSDLKNENGYCLDRIDNSKGYVVTNVVGCCKVCNRAKSNMDVHDFTNWLQKAGAHIQAQIQISKEISQLGITQEMFDMISNELFNEAVKNSPRSRIKIVNS